jgi:ribulose-5-phosphate 4-epimerase/fuculose-1-phosphate aldolase
MFNVSDDDQRSELALANRILFNEGVVDGYGHVSVRERDRPQHFLQARSLAPALVEPGDIMVHDLEGNLIKGEGELSLERFIHAAIYEARPDVGAIVHSHSHPVVLFSVIDVPLQPLWHVAGFLGLGVARFDSRAAYGDSDLLITDMERGRALALALGDKPLVLMRGHGSACTGPTLRDAVYRAIYTDANAKMQAQAMQFGPVTYLSAGEAVYCNESAMKPKVLARPWDLWQRDVRAGAQISESNARD